MKILLVGIFSLGISIAPSSSFSAKAISDPDCGMEKVDLKLDPEALVKVYVEKDSTPDKKGNREWIKNAQLCPELDAGSDSP